MTSGDRREDEASRSATSPSDVALRGACGGADLDEVETEAIVERGVAPPDRAQDVGRQPAVARAGLDEIERGTRGSGLGASRSRGHLERAGLREKLAEERPDVDAGKKIARAARSLGGAGVVADVGVVEREVHERGHGQRAAFLDEVSSRRYSFLTVTKISASPRQRRICAMRPDATACSSRAASAAFETGLRFTDRMTSPARSRTGRPGHPDPRR